MTATSLERWRNSRLLIALLFFTSIVTGAAGLLLALAAIGLEIPFTFGALPQSAFALLAGLAAIRGAMWQWSLARTTARNEVRFEPDAACIVRAGDNQRILWADIAGVMRDGGAVTIRESDGSAVSFNAYDFFMPARLGKAIAARAGKEFK